MADVMEVTKENFDETVSAGTVLVDVWGPDCKPCVALEPHVEKISAERDDVKVVKLEAPKARRLCMKLGLMGLPVFLLYRDGEEVARLSGPQVTPQSLHAWVENSLSESGRG
ncbi:MAG TPA: thioredoxin family protein [Actinomycetota bacterium]|nr:thioredoxin family protein [Actinomycetota bacterium]